MGTPLQLLILAFLIISTTALTTSSLPSPPSLSTSWTSTYPDQTYPLHLFGPVLENLGFQELASVAPSLSNTTSWRGPVTIFAPTDSSIFTCGLSCSTPLLLQEHTVPGLFSLRYLRTLDFGTKIETLSPGRCLTITSTHNASKIFVGGVEITHPELFDDGLVIVHGLQGFVSHLSPFSCSIERMTSLSFLTLPTQEEASSSFIMRLMLRDAMFRLRISGYSIVAVALRVKYPELVDLKAVTVFALNDAAIFSGGHEYVSDFRFHVVPNRLLLACDLDRLSAGTVLSTLNLGHDLVVTTGDGGGIPFVPMRINYVKIARPNLMYNLKMAVHGLSMPFPHVNLTAAIGLGQVQRSTYGAAGSEMAGNADIGHSEWTDEIDDHHGL